MRLRPTQPPLRVFVLCDITSEHIQFSRFPDCLDIISHSVWKVKAFLKVFLIFCFVLEGSLILFLGGLLRVDFPFLIPLFSFQSEETEVDHGEKEKAKDETEDTRKNYCTQKDGGINVEMQNAKEVE